jgi:demethylmenaquinone methyltransferase / 2-methoxy-6-polyprenyl-1,4-benzoquinol methylase
MDNPKRPNSKARDVRAMFSRIARRYDLMNSLMTFGMHGRWRRLAAKASQPAGALALDAGAGTGDLALAVARAGALRVIAVDFSEAMLVEARLKFEAARFGAPGKLGFLPHPNPLPRGGGSGPIAGVAADTMRLPFPDETFDCITNGFLLRNVAGLEETFAEFKRVLKPGGRLVCLEITHAPPLIAPFFRPYFERVVPMMGRLIAGDSAAYTYLPASVRPFPTADRLAGMIRDSGFTDVRYRRLSIGVVALHVGTKPNGKP